MRENEIKGLCVLCKKINHEKYLKNKKHELKLDRVNN
jgi:hypothetical protein